MSKRRPLFKWKSVHPATKDIVSSLGISQIFFIKNIHILFMVKQQKATSSRRGLK